MKDFLSLFDEELKEIYCAEKSFCDLMRDVIANTKNQELKKSIKQHSSVTENQFKRLELIASEMAIALQDVKCQPMQGFWADWEKLKNQGYSDDVLDAAIIAFLQKIKHFEISCYGTLKCFARHLSKKNIASLLRESIREEILFDELLTQIAESDSSGINCKACHKKTA